MGLQHKDLATAYYNRGLAKQKQRDATGGNADIAAAKAIQAGIADVLRGRMEKGLPCGA